MRTWVSFRVISRSGTPTAAVTQALGIVPSKVAEAGRVISPHNPGRTTTHSVWILRNGSEPAADARLSDVLDQLLDQLGPVADGLWQLAKDGYWINWLCMLDVGDGEHATELPRETMQRLLALPGDLWLDVYRDEDDDLSE